jgi:hypothetical protein
MRIQKITKHKFQGKEYNSLKEIKEEIQDIIGLEVLDKIARTCPLEKHKDYLKLLELLCCKEVRDVLVACLTVTFEKEIEYYDRDSLQEDTEIINILDI